MENRENGEKKGVLGAKGPNLFEIAQVAALLSERETGVSYTSMCSKTRDSEVHKARLLFVGITTSLGLSVGHIAQIIYKKAVIIGQLKADFDKKGAKTDYYTQIIREAKELLTQKQ